MGREGATKKPLWNREKLKERTTFPGFSYRKSPYPTRYEFKTSERQLVDCSFGPASTTNNLLLLLPPLRLCCATTQFGALGAGQRIQGLSLFITILIVFLAGLKRSLMCHHLLSLLITVALQTNKVKMSSSISVETYRRALHLKRQCSHRPANNHRILFFISLSTDIFSLLVSLTSKWLTNLNLTLLSGNCTYIERQMKVRGKRQKEGEERKIFSLRLYHSFTIKHKWQTHQAWTVTVSPVQREKKHHWKSCFERGIRPIAIS